MDDPTVCCPASGGYCDRCDVIVGVDGLHVTAVERDERGRLVVTVESEPTVMGCPACGVVARGHGRDEVDAGRRAGVRCPGADPVAQAAVGVPGRGLPGRVVHRAGRVGRGAAGEADGAGVPVGDRADPPRARLGERGPPSARDQLVDGVDLDRADPGRGRRG